MSFICPLSMRHLLVLLTVVALAFVVAHPLFGQDAGNASNDEDQLISLNLPEDIELKLLIALVSDQLDVKILYDQQVGNKRVTVKAPVKVPRDSLLGLLESTLRMSGLALVSDDQPGWYRIVEARQLPKFSGPVIDSPDEAKRATTPVTQIFSLAHADPQRVDAVIKPFLTEPGGNTILVQEQRFLIVTDYAANVRRVASLIERLDQPRPAIHTRFVKIEHLPAERVATELKRIVAATRKVGETPVSADVVEILDLARTNELVLIGNAASVDQVAAMVAPLDVPLGLETKVYRFESISPKQVDTLARGLLGDRAKEQFDSSVDETMGLLIVTGTPRVHAQIESLRKEMDAEVAAGTPVVRFHKLANATVTDVMATIGQIEGVGALAATGQRMEHAPAGEPYRIPPPGPNQPPGAPGEPAPLPPAFREEDPELQRRREGDGGRVGGTHVTDKARIVADVHTNTLIIVAEPAVQELYARMIEKLDRRRPQVLLEVLLVTLDTSGSFSLGVEISGRRDNGTRVLTFSSFGLSEVDENTGQLSLTPGLGFNGAVLTSDIAEVVIRALSTSGRARVFSAPKILVNDNATGVLTSANDAPFASVNASTTVSTTSFGGFESAGTSITITPHIAEGDHLTLDYSIQLSAFTGDAIDGLPPPRQRNEVNSQVTIPDGHTIVVGGLKRTDFNETITRVPFLGDIPLVEYLFSSRTRNQAESTLFVFIRPVILRDDRFRDLKFLSERDLFTAEMPSNYPKSEPMLVR